MTSTDPRTHQPVSVFDASGRYALPPDGFIHVQPFGEYEFFADQDGALVSRGIMVIDRDSVLAQIAAFEIERGSAGQSWAGLLVDFDHFSMDKSHESRAAGWVIALESRADGLYAKVRWSASGVAAVEGGDYRYTSNVHIPSQVKWIDDRRFRPLRVDRFALTNDPKFLQGNYRMRPITSRAEGPSAGTSTTPETRQTKGAQTMDHKGMLLELLGLPAEATDEQVQEAIGKAKSAMQSNASAATQLETAQREKEVLTSRATAAEKALAEFKAEQTLAALEKDGFTFLSRDLVRKNLVIAHDETIALVRAVGSTKAVDGETIRKGGAHPSEAAGSSYESRRQERETFIGEMQKKHSIRSRSEAWRKAQSLKPELFQ